MEMNSRITLQPAYVLHRRPFRNTSLLVDLFTLDFGLIRAVAKGARRQKSRSRALLQLFQPLLVSVSGKGEVKTLTSVESNVSALRLQGVRLLSGLYVNELLSRLLQNQEEHAGLYESYRET
ncbi:MAG: DNA repair protein RecO, partial [Pseudomonadota bacterium]|nr:DNA repair protein RecO [Pseudomonadota bacterium]